MPVAFSDAMRIVTNANTRVYLVGKGRMWYPYRLEHCGDARPSTRENCLEYMIDSHFGNDDITNEYLLERAVERNATYIIPKDYEDRQETTESIREFNELYATSASNARVLYPLQPPYTVHYQELVDELGFAPSHFSLGGMAKAAPQDQVDAIREFRDLVGYDPYVHGLGMGSSIEAIKAVREDARLLDSLDLNSPIRDAINNKVLNKYAERVRCYLPHGTDSTVITNLVADWQILQLNYLMSPSCTDKELLAHIEELETDTNEDHE